MDLVKRYIAAVQRELPEAKRADIGRELQANILDEIEAQQGSAESITDQQIAQILRNMGDPRTVAMQFCPPKPLVALHLMPSYLHTLYLVLGILFLLHLVDAVNWLVTGASIDIWLFNKGLFGGWVESALVAFTMITLIYVALSQQPSASAARQWDPLKLPAADATWQNIRIGDMVTDLVTHVFLLVLILHPYLQMFLHEQHSESFFSPHVQWLLFAFVPVLIIGIAHTFWQFHRRFWSRPMLLLNIAINLVYCVAFGWLALNGPVLNLNPDNWQGVFTLERMDRAVSITLGIILLFPAYQVFRDSRRLRKGAGS